MQSIEASVYPDSQIIDICFIMSSFTDHVNFCAKPLYVFLIMDYSLPRLFTQTLKEYTQRVLLNTRFFSATWNRSTAVFLPAVYVSAVGQGHA